MPCDDDDDDDDDGGGGDRERMQSMSFVVVCRHSDTNPNGDSDKEDEHWLASEIQNLEVQRYGIDRLTNDPKADPLLSPRRPGFDDCSTKVLISLVQIDDCVLRLLFSVLYSRLLLNDGGFHILEELSKLDHLPLNLLDGLVSALNGA